MANLNYRGMIGESEIFSRIASGFNKVICESAGGCKPGDKGCRLFRISYSEDDGKWTGGTDVYAHNEEEARKSFYTQRGIKPESKIEKIVDVGEMKPFDEAEGDTQDATPPAEGTDGGTEGDAGDAGTPPADGTEGGTDGDTYDDAANATPQQINGSLNEDCGYFDDDDEVYIGRNNEYYNEDPDDESVFEKPMWDVAYSADAKEFAPEGPVYKLTADGKCDLGDWIDAEQVGYDLCNGRMKDYPRKHYSSEEEWEYLTDPKNGMAEKVEVGGQKKPMKPLVVGEGIADDARSLRYKLGGVAVGAATGNPEVGSSIAAMGESCGCGKGKSKKLMIKEGAPKVGKKMLVSEEVKLCKTCGNPLDETGTCQDCQGYSQVKESDLGDGTKILEILKEMRERLESGQKADALVRLYMSHIVRHASALSVPAVYQNIRRAVGAMYNASLEKGFNSTACEIYLGQIEEIVSKFVRVSHDSINEEREWDGNERDANGQMTGTNYANRDRWDSRRHPERIFKLGCGMDERSFAQKQRIRQNREENKAAFRDFLKGGGKLRPASDVTVDDAK